MGLLGSGRNENFGFIENLRTSEVVVLKELANWNYFSQRATSFNIAHRAGFSTSSAQKALQYLQMRGIVQRTDGRSWFISPKLKDRIKEFYPISSQSEKPAVVQPQQKTLVE